jgi:hypothetical protein
MRGTGAMPSLTVSNHQYDSSPAIIRSSKGVQLDLSVGYTTFMIMRTLELCRQSANQD